jgi:hypothetical protein
MSAQIEASRRTECASHLGVTIVRPSQKCGRREKTPSDLHACDTTIARVYVSSARIPP